MKKVILPCFLLFGFSTAYSQSSLEVPGQLKVSIENVQCLKRSWDGVVEFDGHGNEVSVTYSYRIYARSNWAAVKKGADGTVIYGSNVNGMTRAGTETPDLGGIKEGDKVNIFKTIFDEHIEAGDYIIIAPTVWEWDRPEKNTINSFNAQLEMDLDWAIKQAYPFPDAAINATKPFDNRVFQIFDKYKYGPALKYQSIFSPIICNGNIQGNRIIGLNAGGSGPACQIAYPPTLFVLDTRVLGALYLNNQKSLRNQQSGTPGPAFITGKTILFEESTYNIQSSNGSYAVFLKIEFIPDVLPSFASSNTSGNGLTGTPTKNVGVPKKMLQEKPINILNTALNLPGNWTGTYGYGESNTQNYYRLNFNANGSMEVLDQFGVVQARGTYVYTQTSNTITAAYTYLSGDSFELTGTITNNTFNAQWWRKNNMTHGGKMIVYKK